MKLDKYFFVDKWVTIALLLWLAAMGGLAWWTMTHQAGQVAQWR